MANRRMFCKDITRSDAFLDMPMSSQLLYFHLGMDADDDGFVSSPSMTCRVCGASKDDLKVLEAKRFVLKFDSGVYLIKHWKMNNYIQKDRYTPTVYKDEMAQVFVKGNKSYTLDPSKAKNAPLPACIQDVYKMDTQVRLGKVRLGKSSCCCNQLTGCNSEAVENCGIVENNNDNYFQIRKFFQEILYPDDKETAKAQALHFIAYNSDRHADFGSWDMERVKDMARRWKERDR